MDAKDPAHERVKKIARDSLHRLTAMTAQMLDISRLEAGEMPLQTRLGDLVQTAKAALESALCVADPKPCSIRDFGPVLAIYDPDVIHRVIYNLLGNAQKFTPRGGEIQVRVEVRNGMACVAIEDNGRGIPPEHQSRIFEKFAQVNGKAGHFGTGLGLAFCKLAVRAHGGQVGVESALGKGSTFWFSLPLARRRDRGRGEGF
jgi:two-component system sensor histidine kinase/response regulator